MQNENHKIQISAELDPRIFAETLIAAFEGGSNYWYWLDTNDNWYDRVNHCDILLAKKQGRTTREPLSVRIVNAILAMDDLIVPIYDAEDPTDKLGNLTQSGLFDAIKICAEQHPDIFSNIQTGQYDAADADAFFQLCLFTDVIYG